MTSLGTVASSAKVKTGTLVPESGYMWAVRCMLAEPVVGPGLEAPMASRYADETRGRLFDR